VKNSTSVPIVEKRLLGKDIGRPMSVFILEKGLLNVKFVRRISLIALDSGDTNSGITMETPSCSNAHFATRALGRKEIRNSMKEYIREKNHTSVLSAGGNFQIVLLVKNTS
jgi:hypothetical protein